MTEPISVTIEGVPQSITRAQYVAVIQSLGLDPRRLSDLEFGTKAIYATVIARHPTTGHDYLDPAVPNEIAKHRIVIPIED